MNNKPNENFSQGVSCGIFITITGSLTLYGLYSLIWDLFTL